MMENIEAYEKKMHGYVKVYKGFEKIARNYEKAENYESADLYRKISDKFREIHEKCIANIRLLREGQYKNERENISGTVGDNKS